MKADSAAKIRVSSLVSGCRNDSLNVAWAKITANKKNMAMQSAMMAGVRLRFFSGRVGELTGDIGGQTMVGRRTIIPQARLRDGRLLRLGLIIPAISRKVALPPDPSSSPGDVS